MSDVKNKKYFAHETACIEKNVKIGALTRIWHFSHIMDGAKIGKACNIGQNVFIDSGVVVGDKVKIQNNVSVYRKVTLGDGVFCGPSCVFTNVINPRSFYPRREDEFLETAVLTGATIGANATIVCGNKLGRHSFIGAGAVVVKDVKDYALVVGNPARQIGWVCECGERMIFKEAPRKKTFLCRKCGKIYKLTGEKVLRIGAGK